MKGLPVPKPDPKCFGRGGIHKLSIDKTKVGYKEWRRRCTSQGEALHKAIGDTITGPVSIEVTFTLPRPASAPKDRVWPIVRVGDVDKLARLLLDALTDAELWDDDSRVVELTSRKAYPTTPTYDVLDDAGATIRVWRTPHEQ